MKTESKSSATAGMLRRSGDSILQTVMTDLGVSQRDLCKALCLSLASAHRLARFGEFPLRANRAVIARRLGQLLVSRGGTAAHWLALGELALPPEEDGAENAAPTNELAPEGVRPSEAVRKAKASNPTPTEDTMLLRNESLTQQSRKAFGLARNPFADDVQHRDDVFISPGIRYVRAALLDAAMNHGFIAIVGESGSGKTTLVEELEERIREEGKDVLVIRPYVLGMEVNDQKGKTLKAGAIAEAIAKTLDPNVQLLSSPQARFHQIHQMLKASRRAGRRHLLVIEEGHCLPVATLKHLKRFLELKDGLQRLIGIALIAQPELADRLSSQNAEVREVMQRCEIVQMEPLDNELEAYLRHKLARSDVKLEAVLEPDAVDAIRARLVQIPRGGKAGDAVSMCFPLVVNNLVCRALNAAARAGWPKVDAQVIAGC